MKRIIPLALIALTLSGGVALADRDGRWRDTSDRSGGTVVTPTRGYDRGRDNRWDNSRRYDNRRNDDRRWDNRRNDNSRSARVVHVHRARPSFRNNRFYFTGGNYQTYQRPVIQYRYRNYYQRPALVGENMQPVSGYVWTQGNWQWDGYEWQWIAGHYDVDQSYQEPYYNDYSNYDDDDDDDYDNYRSGYQGGVSVQGSWNF